VDAGAVHLKKTPEDMSAECGGGLIDIKPNSFEVNPRYKKQKH
jgi:rRNA maturation protein Nop10